MDSDDFKFEEIKEETEKLDCEHLVPCPHCKKPIPVDAMMCLYCGEEVYFPKKKSWVFWTAITLIIVFVLMAIAIF